jgi:hypothetical protein
VIDYINYLSFLPDQTCRQAGASQSGGHFFRTHVSYLPTKEKKESKNPRIFKAPEVPNWPTSDKKEKAERQKKINPVIASAKSGWLRKFSRNRACP